MTVIKSTNHHAKYHDHGHVRFNTLPHGFFTLCLSTHSLIVFIPFSLAGHPARARCQHSFRRDVHGHHACACCSAGLAAPQVGVASNRFSHPSHPVLGSPLPRFYHCIDAILNPSYTTLSVEFAFVWRLVPRHDHVDTQIAGLCALFSL